MRLHELTKELDADGKRLLEIAKELGLGVKSHSSNLAKGTEGILRAAWSEEAEDIARRQAKKAAKAAAEAKAAGGDAGEPSADVQAEVAPEVAVSEPGTEASIAVTIQGRSMKSAAAQEPETADEAVAEIPTEAEVLEPAIENVATPEPEVPEQPSETEPVAAVEQEVIGEPEAAAVDEPKAVETPAGTEEAHHETNMPVVVTFGGQPAGSENDAEPEEPPVDEKRAVAREGSRVRDDADQDSADVEVRGVVNVPTSRERKGAKILGRIELKPVDKDRGRRAAEPAFDPMDPTRALPDRRSSLDKAKEHEPRGKARGAVKGGQGDFVFDPEDNTSLSAIRLGHFGNRRRPPPRRPPVRRGRGGPRKARKAVLRPTHAVTLRPPIGVRELSEELGIKAREILQHFPEFDPRDKNAVLEAEHLVALAEKLGRDITVLDPDTAEGRLLIREEERADAMAQGDVPRPPVVAVMGHVDHGKTTLLDYIRKTRVAAKEAGGITQVTSAYAVKTPGGASVTFLDTPGHKAFTEMRARGASVTDVALLVVAADDGVMEQTQEAIDHARAAGVPLVVAINKIDKNNANVMRVRQQLASVEVLVEDYGGEVGVIECSATTGQGIDELLERLALETELLELRADEHVPARGVVIDSRKDPKLGIVTTVVVQEGTLRVKDALLAGTSVGRVRWLLDDRGQRITEAGPSMPVQVVGFEEPPNAGVQLLAVEDINTARDVANERRIASIERQEAVVDTVTMENLFEAIEAQKVTEVNVILKADNMGSLDVVRQTVEEVIHPEVRFKVIRAGVGGVTEDDVLLASASKAFIIAFGVVPDVRARAAVQQQGVEVKFYDVIYEMVDDLEAALEGQLGTEKKEAVIGHAVIRAIFKVSRLGNIAGCYVTDGILTRDCHVRLVRDGSVIFSGKLASLKRFKDDVKEVRENYECGLNIAGYNDIKEEDVLEAFTVTEVKRTLESTSPSSE